MTSIGNLSLRAYEPGDEQQILALFEKSYSRKLSIDYWRWRFADNAAGPAVIFLAWEGDVLAAHYAVSRVVLSVRGRDVQSALSGTTMTHPDYRGMGLFPQLARRTYDEMRRLGMSLVWGFPNANSHRGFIQDLAWKDIYEIPTMRADVATMKTGATPAAETPSIDATMFDAFWQRVAAQHAIFVKRDSRYITWRFARNPNETYRFVTLVDGSTLRGYAIFKRYKDQLQIVDMLTEQPEMAQQLVEAVVAIARTEAATAISTWMPVASPVHRVLEKAGFQNEGLVTYFGALVLADLDPALVYSPFSWHYSMGDSDVY